MAPLVVKDKVLVGNSGGEYGVRGWIAGARRRSGKSVWNAYSTGPDKDVLIGPSFKPFYDSDKGQDLGVKTWPPNAWEQGGGTVWGWISYDPDLNLIYYGTGNPGPWNADQRPGDNKWTSGIFARDADTGEARWFYQWSPHDIHDWDGINEQILLDMEWNGQPRKVLVRPERNGYVYVLDRATGEVLSAKLYHANTTTRGVDLKTGRLEYLRREDAGREPRHARHLSDRVRRQGLEPVRLLAHRRASSTSRTPTCAWTSCTWMRTTSPARPISAPKCGSSPARAAIAASSSAWDISEGREVWTVNENFPIWSGADRHGRRRRLLRHHGRLVQSRCMRAPANSCGSSRPRSGIIGQPTTYRGPDGRQYVAILSASAAGPARWCPAISTCATARRRSASSMSCATCKDATTKGGTLYVFRLP